MSDVKAGYCLMNYTIQCTDIDSGKVGSFLFDEARYRLYGDFRAVSEVFPDLQSLFTWSRSNGDPCKSAYVERIAPTTASNVLESLEERFGNLFEATTWNSEPEALFALLVHEQGFRPKNYPNAKVYMDGGLLVVEPSRNSPWYFDENRASKVVYDGSVLIAHDQQGFAMEFSACN
jgi:hypothetical protein